MLDEAFALLCLQAEWGADEAIEPDPIDRLRPVEPRPAATPRPAPPAPAAAAQPRGSAAERALAAAAGAATLDELRAAIAAFDGCALRDTASNLVFAEGNPEATTLLIGEPPGRDEDRSGHPFAGAEGHLLDQMLASIDLTRSELMLAHVLPWRPPGGRPANPPELALCLPFLHRLIVLLQPRRTLLLGGTAARAMLPQGATRRRPPREWIDLSIPGLQKPLLALVMPSVADLIKTPVLKRDAWAGWRLLRHALNADLT